MSYILDALKKAEAERKLGSVPNLHAQPVSALSSGRDASLWKRRLMWFALMGLALLIALAGAIWLRPLQTPPAASVALAPAVESSPAAPPSVPSAAAELPPMPERSVTANPPLEKSLAAPAVQPHARTAHEPHEPVKKQPVQKNPERSVADAALAENRVGLLRDLPENIQREIPALSISGYIYSDNKADRSILINQKLMHEGESIAPGFTLEKMMPREAVFNYKGYRYRIVY